jgi:hypothetical protein
MVGKIGEHGLIGLDGLVNAPLFDQALGPV